MREFTGIGGLILLGLVIWAIIATIASNASTGKKVFWVLLVVLLPVIGFIAWLIAGPRPAPTVR